MCRKPVSDAIAGYLTVKILTQHPGSIKGVDVTICFKTDN